MNKEHENLPEEEVTEVELGGGPGKACPPGMIPDGKGGCIPDPGAGK